MAVDALDDGAIYLPIRAYLFKNCYDNTRSHSMDMKQIERELLIIGGRSVKPASNLATLKFIVDPQTMTLPQRKVAKMEGSCHCNVISLLVQESIDHVATGFSLGNDEIWHRHSWGIRDGGIIETNGEFTKYWGCVLSKNDVVEFAKVVNAASNLPS